MTFFYSWALWEKMTFVLGLAIVGVFGIGYGKLAWQNRMLRRYQVAEEERRVKVMEMRRSGEPTEAHGCHDIPFGVRAIQSGIQVDGIWVSNNSTPMPSPRLGGDVRKSSLDFSPPISKTQSFMDSSEQAAGGSSGRGRPFLRQSEPGYQFPRKSIGVEVDMKDVRASHTQRRSSHLRFDSCGELPCDESTLNQLEGKPPSRGSTVDIQPQNMEVERSVDAAGYISGARSTLEPTRTERDATYSATTIQSSPPHLLQTQGLAPPPWNRVPPVSRSLKDGYSSIPLILPNEQIQVTHVAPQVTLSETHLSFKQPNTPVSPEQAMPDGSSISCLSQTPLPSRLPSPFIPGELHMNKTARKVNSGFEVLPAGTFGMPMMPSDGREADYDEKRNSDEDKRKSKKLQKKTRNSMSSVRFSMERP